MIQQALQQAKLYISEIVRPGDTVVDATAGNGHDTLFLAKAVGENGKVYAFDVQEQAIHITRERLVKAEESTQVELYLMSHQHLEQVVATPIQAAMFNLGYLPGADHEITTHATSTWQAIQSCLELLSAGGRVIVVLYHGHPSGKLERTYILDQAALLAQEQYQVLHSAFLNQQNSPPEFLVIEKKKQPAK